jgi:hypothetical protein
MHVVNEIPPWDFTCNYQESIAHRARLVLLVNQVVITATERLKVGELPLHVCNTEQLDGEAAVTNQHEASLKHFGKHLQSSV